MNLQQTSLEIYEKKYQLKDANGQVIDKSIEDTFRRVAKRLASVEVEQELWEDAFFKAMQDGAIPAGRILSNAGAEEYKPNTSLINCTVSGEVSDNIGSIGQMVKEAMQTLAAGCGIGYCFSTLRPKGAYVGGVGATTSGSLSFMNVFDSACFTIASAGGRRGAQMATMHIWHPDIIDFIKAKREDGRFRQFNMSVLITDRFMEAVRENKDWELYFPAHKKEDLINATYGGTAILDFPFKSEDYIVEENMTICRIYKVIKARELWDLIMKSTYDFAEPGILFIDRINKENPLNSVEVIHASNPCGEQPLTNYGSCLLGSVMLQNFVRNPFAEGAYFDFDAFAATVKVFARMLDNVVELNGLPLPEQRKEIETKRRHGMGFTGLGSALTMLGIKYGSAIAIKYVDAIANELATINLSVGLDLAVEKGQAPVFDNTTTKIAWVTHPYIQRMLTSSGMELADLLEHGCRFTHATSIAPTGTISLSIGNNCSNGIEPTFAHSYKRNVIVEGKASKEQVDVYSYEALLWRDMFGDTPFPYYFISADDVTPAEHIAMQAAAQKWVDSSISKTINVPTDYPFENFKNIYQLAYDSGLKGCTTFRFNPEVFSGILVKEEDLKDTFYEFTLENGEIITVAGNEKVSYEGEEHIVANLFDALKEGYYGKF